MDPVFNERKTRAWLEPLSRRARAAFVLSCVERMLPSLVAFHAELDEDAPAEIEEIAAAVWSYMSGGDADTDIAALAERWRKVPPIDEQVESIHTGPAVNARLAITLLLETLRKGSLDKAIEAAAVAADSAESYAVADLGLPPDAENLEARVAAHPLVQQELSRQREDIKLLHRTSLDRPESVPALREKWIGRAITARTP